MKKETAINFMLFSLMEVTLNDKEKGSPVGEDFYIKKAVLRAYRDASSHVLSIEKGEDSDDKKNPYKKNAAVQTLVDKLKEINSQPDYKTWHNDVCKVLVEEYANADYKDKSRKFFYGIAQKWVNMTVKYLAVLYTVMADMDRNQVNQKFMEFYEEKLQKYEREFQIPVDGYILEYIWGTKGEKEEKEIFDSKDRKELLEQQKKEEENGKTSKNASGKINAWSKWKEEFYQKFQEKLRNNLFQGGEEAPLDWEGRIWIESAKK